MLYMRQTLKVMTLHYYRKGGPFLLPKLIFTDLDPRAKSVGGPFPVKHHYIGPLQSSRHSKPIAKIDSIQTLLTL